MKQDFKHNAQTEAAIRPVRINNDSAEAYVFGSGVLSKENVYFIAGNTGISSELEGPDYTEYNAEDRLLAAKKEADKVGAPCVVVVVLDEYKASYDRQAVLDQVNNRPAAKEQGLIGALRRLAFG